MSLWTRRTVLGASLMLAICPLHLLSARTAGAQQADDAKLLQSAAPPAGAIWVEGLDLSNMEQDWGTAQVGKSVDKHPLKLKGTLYPHGIGTHSNSIMQIDLKGVATRFVSMVGVDDETGGMGSVVFEVKVDGKK